MGCTPERLFQVRGEDRTVISEFWPERGQDNAVRLGLLTKASIT